MSDGFSLATYRSIVESLVADGYEFRTFHDFDPAARHAVMRHDIDMDLDTALAMSALESELGIRATYFVLTRSDLYSPFSARGRVAIAQLLEDGHEVGLHFDVSLHPEAGIEDLDDLCAHECAALATVTGQDVSIVSFHRPASALIGLDRTIGGRIHTYQPRFFSQMTYRSDSRGQWNPLSPLERAADDPPALQILTHPVWWNSASDEAVIARLDRLLAEKAAVLRSELAANCRPYAEHLGLSDKARTEPFSGG